MRRLLAEAIGTFALVFAGTAAIVTNEATHGSVMLIGIALTFGLVIMAMIYAVGDISGAHFNPAVSLGFVLARRMPGRTAGMYIAAQLAGALVASLAVMAVLPASQNLGATTPTVPPLQAAILEVILTFLLMFTILMVSTGPKETGIMAGIAIGGTIILEILFAGPISGASMNPARSIAPALISRHADAIRLLWIYILGPCLGAAAAVPCAQILRPSSRGPVTRP